jgi:hypothetical protein
MKVKLFTRDGGGFVHEATTPSFYPPPDVIAWGERCFVLGSDYKGEITVDGDGQPTVSYTEAIVYPLPGVPTDPAASGGIEERLVIVDGHVRSWITLDPKKHTYVGTFRPATPPFTTTAVVLCSCGHSLWTVEAVREHWQMGHFDTPQYRTTEGQQL